MAVLLGILKREVILNRTICRIIGVSVFAILTMLGAFIRIPLPFTPVPITLQTFFVLLSGLFLGQNLGGIAQLSYVLLGITGLPVFTGTGNGISYLLGPTGGYLFGFIAASFYVGRFTRYTKDNFFSVIAVLLGGDIILLCCGTVWLKFITGFPSAKLLFIGFLPFVPGDVLKIFVAAALYLRLKSRLKEIW